MAGEDIKRHKQGGWAAARFQRREDEAAYRNLKEVVEMTSEFVHSGDVRRLILGGTDGNVAQFAAMLPKSVQQVVVGRHQRRRQRRTGRSGREVAGADSEVAAARKAKLVDQLITTAAKGGPAALGLANTLVAVDARRAATWCWTTALRRRPMRCDNCGYVGVEPAEGRCLPAVRDGRCGCCRTRPTAWCAGPLSRIST